MTDDMELIEKICTEKYMLGYNLGLKDGIYCSLDYLENNGYTQPYEFVELYKQIKQSIEN